MSKSDNIIKWSIIGIFIGLYILTSTVSTIHAIDFFGLSNPNWLAITLAIAFEIGAACSLGAIVILDKTSKSLVWALFILITLVQVIGNMNFAYTHLQDFKSFSELFGLIDEDLIVQKRIISIISGGILPIVALGFIKSLVDYIRPSTVDDVIDNIHKSTEIEHEIAKELISDEHTQNEISLIENSTATQDEKTRQIDRRIKKAIAESPELKQQLEQKLKELEKEPIGKFSGL